MHNRIRRSLDGWTVLVVLASYAALASTPHYGPVFMLIPVLMLVLKGPGERMDARYRAYRFLTGAATLGFMLALPMLYRTNTRVDFVVYLAIFVQGYKLIHKKVPSDYYTIFLMSLFLLLCACSQGPDAAIGLVFVVFTVSVVGAMFVLQAYSESDRAERIDGTGPPVATAGAESRPRFWDRGLSVLLAVTALTSVVLAAGIFLATPRMEAGFLARNAAGDTATTGLTQSVDITQGGRLSGNMLVSMRVTYPDEPDGMYDAVKYWRVTTMPQYDGRSWNRAPLSRDMQGQTPAEWVRRQDGMAMRWPSRVDNLRRVTQAISLDRVPPQGLPYMPWPMKIRADVQASDVIWDEYNDMTARLSDDWPDEFQYTVESQVLSLDETGLRALPQDFEWYRGVMSRRDYQLLTATPGFSVAAQRLVQELTSEEPTHYDKVRALESYLSGDNFLYTLDVPYLDEQRPMDEFIFEVRRGHCELFASAMALMVRSLGIPARVVSGYRGGEWDNAAQEYVVREEMAHLWVEVLFPEYGWVTFDPSPIEEESELGPIGALTRYLSAKGLRARMFWYSSVIGYDGGINPSTLRAWIDSMVNVDLSRVAGTSDAESGMEGPASSRLTLVIFGGLLLAGIYGLYRSLKANGASTAASVRQTADQRRATSLYLGLLKRLFRRRHPGEAQTAGDVLEEVRQMALAGGPHAERILTIYNEVRFGGRPLSLQQYRELRTLMKQLDAAQRPH